MNGRTFIENGYWETNEVSTFFFGVLPLYGLFMLMGFIVGASWAYIEWNKKKYKTWDFLFMTSFTTIFALYGAKIWYMAFSPVDTFSEVSSLLDFLTILLIPAFGRSILGTIVATPIGLWVWKRYWGGEYKTLELMDIVLPALLISQAFGRFGNLFDHNVYGGVVSDERISWLPDWIQKHLFIMKDGELAYRQPLFLYESMADVIGFVLLIIIFKFNNYWKEGVSAFGYFATYGLIRSIFEPMRDELFKMSWGNFPTSTIVSILLLITGIIGLIWIQWGDIISEKVNTKKRV